MSDFLDKHCVKRSHLDASLRQLSDLVVAYSGGVDSSVLLHAAHGVLGPRAVGFIADSPSLPRRELREARESSTAMGVSLIVVSTDEMALEGYRANTGSRCYFCKSALFEAMAAWASREGFQHMAFGEIVDDWSDDRPGRRAASEASILAPLAEAGFDKEDVRHYAREHGISAAEKPASACLASRIPPGTTVTRERLARVEAAEEAVRNMGFRVLRVRDHGIQARLELGAGEFTIGEEREAELAACLLEHGFASLELAIYRSPG